MSTLGATALAEAVRRIGLGENAAVRPDPHRRRRRARPARRTRDGAASPRRRRPTQDERRPAGPDRRASPPPPSGRRRAATCSRGASTSPTKRVTIRVGRRAHLGDGRRVPRQRRRAWAPRCSTPGSPPPRTHVLGPVAVTEHADGISAAGHAAARRRRRPDLAALYEPMLARETNRRPRHARPPDRRRTAEALRTAAAARRGTPAVADRPTTNIAARRSDARRGGPHPLPDAATARRDDLRAALARRPVPDTGIDVRSLGMDAGDLAVLDILRRPDVMAHLARVGRGTAHSARTPATGCWRAPRWRW